MATLGWNDSTEQEGFTLDELIQKFKSHPCAAKWSRFDERRLLLDENGYNIRQMPLDELYGKVTDFWSSDARSFDATYKEHIIGFIQETTEILHQTAN